MTAKINTCQESNKVTRMTCENSSRGQKQIGLDQFSKNTSRIATNLLNLNHLSLKQMNRQFSTI